MLLAQNLSTSTKELENALSVSKIKSDLSLQERIQNAVNTYSEESNNTAVLLLVSKEGKDYKASAGLADKENKRKVKTEN